MTGTRAARADTWAEPTSLLELRWGRYRPRWMIGLALIVAGTGLVQLTSAYSLPFVLLGVVVEGVGWVVQPTTIARRVAVFLPALAISMALLAGPAFSALFSVLLGCWLLVRLRPPISWIVLAAPIASGILASGVLIYYSQDWLSLLVASCVSVGAAWLARAIAKAWEVRHTVSPDDDVLR